MTSNCLLNSAVCNSVSRSVLVHILRIQCMDKDVDNGGLLCMKLNILSTLVGVSASVINVFKVKKSKQQGSSNIHSTTWRALTTLLLKNELHRINGINTNVTISQLCIPIRYMEKVNNKTFLFWWSTNAKYQQSSFVVSCQYIPATTTLYSRHVFTVGVFYNGRYIISKRRKVNIISR